MGFYNQLSYEERQKIAKLLQSKTRISEIASILKRHKTTILREVNRNEAPPGQYWPDTAQSKARERCKRGNILDKDDELRKFVVEKLTNHYWTPEQIAGYLSKRQSVLRSISHETIYSWIYRKPFSHEDLWKFLPRHKKKRGLRRSNGACQSRIPNRVSIHDRPESVNKKLEFGHWEGDLMSFYKNTQHILTLRERKTMKTLSAQLKDKKAITTANAIKSLLKNIPSEARKTMTLDNGGEFTNHSEIQQELGIQIFFCDPYSPWQKGGIENTNGRLRRDLPRKFNVKSMSKEDFNENIENYNSTPRKKLNWRTPDQLFEKNLQRVALRT